MKTIYIIFGFILFSTNSIIFSQNNLPRLSPKSFVGQTVGYTNVEIAYGSPGVKQRNIWDNLVPFSKVWRTGANEATTIEFDKDVVIEDKRIPSGKYSLFTIPGKDTWIIIFNKVYDQWGAYKYDQKDDQLRFKVSSAPNHHVERLSFSFEYKDPYKSNIIFEWEKLKVSFEINSDVKN